MNEQRLQEIITERNAEIRDLEGEIELLRAEDGSVNLLIEQLRADAERYRYVREVFAKMHSPKMNGQHGWRFHGGLRTTGNTFDEALDKLMAEQPIVK